MKNTLMVSAVIGALMSASAVAQSEGDKAGFYLGGGLSQVDLNSSDLSDPDNYFIQAGYSFTNNFAVEAQYSDSYKDAKESYEGGFGTVNAKTSLNTLAVFGVYRTPGNFYGKLKAGYMDAEANYRITFPGGSESGSTSESGWAAGAGAGFRFGASSIELEYVTTQDKLDLDFINLGYRYSF